MSTLNAAPNVIVVDNTMGLTSGDTNVSYDKAGRFEELWERTSTSSWTLINVHLRTGLGDEADVRGTYAVTLKPGQTYEVAVFQSEHGPLTKDPYLLRNLIVYCLWKKPSNRRLITDENRDTGGTWHWRQIFTQSPTSVISIGVSRHKPTFDENGIPHLSTTEGAPTSPPAFANDHRHEITPLLSGQRYFFVVLVTDPLGNWDFRVDEFTTKQRKVTVKFSGMVIYDDGDNLNTGEGEFWFDIYAAKTLAVSYHQNTMSIDDWSNTGRPYPLSYGPFVIGPQPVVEGEESIGISSHSVEHDGPFEVDDKAATLFGPRRLPLPHGRSSETVSGGTMSVDCQPTSGSLHYSVTTEFSVDYV